MRRRPGRSTSVQNVKTARLTRHSTRHVMADAPSLEGHSGATKRHVPAALDVVVGSIGVSDGAEAGGANGAAGALSPRPAKSITVHLVRRSSPLAVAVAAALAVLTAYGLYSLAATQGDPDVSSTSSNDVGDGSQRRHDLASEAARVWWYAWITAASTALGIAPFCFLAKIEPFWLAVSNAVAGGMMLAASACLAVEGALHDLVHEHLKQVHNASAGAGALEAASGLAGSLHEHGSGIGSGSLLVTLLAGADDDDRGSHTADVWTGASRVAAGLAVGCAFILASKKVLDKYEHLKFVGFEEGVGIGVSFGSLHEHFGVFISATLAVHNIPEGLAIALVLVPRGVPLLEAALWAVFTSLPQPLMALPAFLSVHAFAAILPLGLGFAAGAMTWVAVAELLTEARDEIGYVRTGVVAAAAAGLMLAAQAVLKG